MQSQRGWLIFERTVPTHQMDILYHLWICEPKSEAGVSHGWTPSLTFTVGF